MLEQLATYMQGDHKVEEKNSASFPGFFQSHKLYFSTGYRKKKLM